MSDLFTIVLAHYNQLKYIKNSIFSILMQDYGNIELIITDDASKEFDLEEIEKFINKNKKSNLSSYRFIINEKNLGTVKTLNKALKSAKGKYILFFAADDELYNTSVLSNFVKSFNQKKVNIITSQSFMYDENLCEVFEKYVNKKEAYKLNEMSSFEQFAEMSVRCIYSSGATAYKKEIFDKYGIFDEKYKIIEDWTFWLKVLKSGEKMIYVDFPTLKHRDGGVSHNKSNSDKLPPHVIKYYNDILMAYKDEIMPDINNFDDSHRVQIIDRYVFHIDHFSKQNEEIKRDFLIERNNFFNIYNIDENDYISKKYKIILLKKAKNFFRWKILDRIVNFQNYDNTLLLSFILCINIITKLFNIYNFNLNIFNVYMPFIFALIFIIMQKMKNYNRLMPYCFTLSTILTNLISLKTNNLNTLLTLFLGTYIICNFIINFIRIVKRINNNIRKAKI